MRTLASLALAALAMLAAVSPAAARVVYIQTRAALQDHTEDGVEQAIRRALDTAVDGALAMGLTRMRVEHASVLADTVVISVVAADDADDVDDEEEQDCGIDLEQENT